MEQQTDRVLRRMSVMESLRQPHEGEARECFDYTYPERGMGLQGSISTAADAKAKAAEIYDDTAKDGSRILASAFSAGMTPANSLWFGMDAGGGELEADTRWLSDGSQFIFDNIHGANFDSASFECNIDMAAGGGLFVLYIEEEDEGGYRFEQWPVGQCYVSSTKSGGIIDTIYRSFTMSVEQCVAYYGQDKVSDRTRENYIRGRFDEPVQIVWTIEPRESARRYEGGTLTAGNKPWTSIHVERDAKHLCRESGYDEFPCCVPRWMLIPGSHYAKGPMSACLATVKTLNELQRLELINLEMVAYGMYKATDDGVLNPFTTKIGPRRIVVVSDMKNFERVEPAGDFKLSFAKKEEMQRQVRKLLLADQLHPQDGPAMTATEVHARLMLIRQQLGPIFGRLQAEWLKPLIERCFGIALRSGALERAIGRIPETLRDRVVNITYSSPLARAQKLEEVSAIDQWVAGLVGYAASAQDTSVLDQIDTEEAGRFKADALGVPAKIVRTSDDMAMIRQNRIDAQKEVDQAAQAQQLQATAGEAAIKQAIPQTAPA